MGSEAVSAPVRVVVILLLVGLLFYLVLSLARGVSAEEPDAVPPSLEGILDEPMDADERVNLEADRDPNDPGAAAVDEAIPDPRSEPAADADEEP